MAKIFVATLMLTILSLLSSLSPGHAQFVWDPTPLINGPTEDRPFAKVVCDPSDPDIVWALTSNVPDPSSATVDPAQGVYKSTDQGVTWSPVNDAVLRTEVNALDIAISHTNSNVVYIASNVEGIFKTVDGGQSWSTVNSGITHGSRSFPDSTWAALAIAVDPTDDDIVYCGVANANNIDYLSGSGDHPGFYKSTNGGASWTARNGGLPARYDPIDLFDSVSHTSTVASIAVIPQSPNIVVIGMSDHEVNVALFGNKTASTRGRMFYSTDRVNGNWTELSTGLPEVIQGSTFGDLARVSFSQLHLAAIPSGSIGLYGSHIGGGVQVFLDTIVAKSKSRGVYKYDSGSWVGRNNGLPVVNDEFNENATNAGPVAISPVNSNILLVGIGLSDGGDPGSDRSKVYASPNSGSSWIKNWDSGMSNSPNYGYTEANPGFVCINLDQSAAFSSVIWGDGSGPDDGIYKLTPP
jgi:hypothetical protein